MGNKALGRDLGDLLSRARPARIVRQVASPTGMGPLSEAVPAAVPSGAGDSGNPAPTLPGLLRPADASPAFSLPGTEGEGVVGLPGAILPGPASRGLPATTTATATVAATTRSGRPPMFHFLVWVDVVLVGSALALAYSGWLDHPAARAGAVLAVAIGGAAGALAATLPRTVVLGPTAPETRVRVHLTRV